jgi:hypothetical protein
MEPICSSLLYFSSFQGSFLFLQVYFFYFVSSRLVSIDIFFLLLLCLVDSGVVETAKTRAGTVKYSIFKTCCIFLPCMYHNRLSLVVLFLTCQNQNVIVLLVASILFIVEYFTESNLFY